MGLHTNCESVTRRDCLRLGLGALIGGGLVDALRVRGEAALAGPTAVELHPDLDGRRAEPLRDVRPQAGRTQEIRGEFSPIDDVGPGDPLLRADDAAGGDRRQARDRPFDPPQPGEPRRRQPLHDDRRPAPDPGRLRRVRQLPSQPGLGDGVMSAGRSAACRLFLDPQHVALGRPELPGCEVRSVRRPRRSQSPWLPGPRRGAAPRAGRRSGRTPTRPARASRPLPTLLGRGRRRSGRGARHLLRAGLRPDVLARRAAGLRHSATSPTQSATPTAATRSASGPAGPSAGRGRRAVRHPLPGGLGPSCRHFQGVSAADGGVRVDDRRADRGPGPSRAAGDHAGHRPGRVRPDAEDQQGRRPRPLVQRHVGPVRGLRNAGRPGRRRDRPPRLCRRIERVLSPENFASTVYTKLGIDPARIFHAPNGRPVQLVSDPTPIRELMG